MLMNKKYFVSAAFIILSVAVSFSGGCAFAETSYYLSPNGDDSNPGTQTRPLRTLEAVKYKLRQSKPSSAATIRLMDGRYELSQTFEMTAEDTGTAESLIMFKAVNRANPVITGSRVLPVDKWKPFANPGTTNKVNPQAEEHILQINLGELGLSDYGLMRGRGFSEPVYPLEMELFFNHKRMQLARWPNEGFARYGKVIDKGSTPRTRDYSRRPGILEFKDERIKDWHNLKDAWLHGTWAYDWADKRIPLLDVDSQKGQITVGTSLYGFKPGRRFYFLNALIELDSPGEYYIDRDAGVLYFWPPAPIDSAVAAVSVLDKPLVTMNGVSYVTWQGITFEDSRSMAISMVNGSYNKIVGCTLRNLGTAAISIGQGEYGLEVGAYGYGGWDEDRGLYANTAWNRNAGTNNGVISCDIYDIAAYGILLGGGDRKTLTPGNNYVTNCDIYRTARVYEQMFPNVSIDGVGNRVTHNHIHHNPHSGIMYWGNNHLIEYNEIDNCVYDSSDAGAIYTGRDPSGQGNIIRYNFFHHIKGNSDYEGIFFDDGASGQLVYGNVFHSIKSCGAVKYHGGQSNDFVNNIVVDCSKPVHYSLWNQRRWDDQLKGELFQKRLREAVDILKPPYSVQYPKLAKIYETPYSKDTHTEQRNYITTTSDSLFVDGARMNFAVKNYESLRKKVEGFEKISFDKIGLYKDDFRKAFKLSVPRIEPKEGLFYSEAMVHIYPAYNDAKRAIDIRYTLDGTIPTPQSLLYQKPFRINRTSWINARVFDKVNPILASEMESAGIEVVRFEKNKTLYLSQLIPEKKDVHARLVRDENYGENGPIVIDGNVFFKGLISCPKMPDGRGYVIYDIKSLPFEYKYFKAQAGIEDSVGDDGSAEFIVELFRDGKWRQVFKSPVLKGSDKAVTIDVDIDSSEKLKLLTTDGGDNINADHAAWGDARLEPSHLIQ